MCKEILAELAVAPPQIESLNLLSRIFFSAIPVAPAGCRPLHMAMRRELAVATDPPSVFVQKDWAVPALPQARCAQQCQGT